MTLLDGQLWTLGYGGIARGPGQGYIVGRRRAVTYNENCEPSTVNTAELLGPQELRLPLRQGSEKLTPAHS